MSLSLCHFLNDMNQSLVPAIYPILKESYRLDFGQIGMITLAFQLTASLLQPVVGMVTDKRPTPFSLPVAMACSLVGLLMLSVAGSYPMILLSAAMVGLGSSVFHPEASRVARMASGGRYGFAQSLFQLGGSLRLRDRAAAGGVRCGAARPGQYLLVFGGGAAGDPDADQCQLLVCAASGHPGTARAAHPGGDSQPRHCRAAKWLMAITVILILLFSKNVYTSSLSSYYTFYLIQKFHLSVQNAQYMLFAFLGAVAAGTFAGGPIGDRVGRKPVIWFSILGAFPFALMLPYAGLMWTGILSVLIGLILASAFSAIIVYAQELLPGRIGLVAGMMFGFSFGLGGLGAAALGRIADVTGIETVYRVCSFLPLIGLLTALLPDVERRK